MEISKDFVMNGKKCTARQSQQCAAKDAHGGKAIAVRLALKTKRKELIDPSEFLLKKPKH